MTHKLLNHAWHLMSGTLFLLAFLLPNALKAQLDLDDCGSIHCWQKTYLTGGTLDCADGVSVTDQFETLNDWYTHLYSDPNHPNARLHTTCSESFFLDENISTGPNGCTILGLYEPNTVLVATNPDDENDPPVEYIRDFTSGTLYSKQQYHFGRFEVKITEMPGHGWWPSFWMWHHEELDVMERFDEEYYAYNSYPSTICDGGHQHRPENSLFDVGTHIFSMEWTPFKVTFFYNDVPLPNVSYRYYNLDGTPLDIECGEAIPSGFFYTNPNFILPWRDYPDLSEATNFSPIIGMMVLPRHGGKCCGYNDFCGDNNCTAGCLESDDLGNPIDENGVPKPNYEPNTQMIIDYVKTDRKSYLSCEGVAITYPTQVCVGDSVEVIIESIAAGSDLLHMVPAEFSGLHLFTNAGSNNYHKRYLIPTSAGIGQFHLTYTDDCGVTRFHRGLIEILETSECLNSCDNTYSQHECCPPNTFFDGQNCFYGYLPDAVHAPYLFHNTLYALPYFGPGSQPNGCPPGYNLEGSVCNSGITVPEGYEAFIHDGGLYAERSCDNITDCCPNGFEFDGANCYSGIYVPGYTPFVYGNLFYVHPNCSISMENNCCPAGFEFDGANCYSGVQIPEGFSWFMFENSLYLTPICDTISDCCPIGSTYDGANCNFGEFQSGNSAFIYNNTFYLVPDCDPNGLNCCPTGYTQDEVGCNSGKSYPSGFAGFIYGTSFYTQPHCPGDSYNNWTLSQLAGCPDFRFIVNLPNNELFPQGTTFNFYLDGQGISANGNVLIIPYSTMTPGTHSLCVNVTVPGHGTTQKCINFVVDCDPWSLVQIGNICPLVRFRLLPNSGYSLPPDATYTYTLDNAPVAGNGTYFTIPAWQLQNGWHTLCINIHVPGMPIQTECQSFGVNCNQDREGEAENEDALLELTVTSLVTDQISFSGKVTEGKAFLFDANGNKAAQFKLKNTKNLNVAELPAGHYVLQISTKDSFKSFRIVKMNN